MSLPWIGWRRPAFTGKSFLRYHLWRQVCEGPTYRETLELVRWAIVGTTDEPMVLRFGRHPCDGAELPTALPEPEIRPTRYISRTAVTGREAVLAVFQPGIWLQVSDVCEQLGLAAPSLQGHIRDTLESLCIEGVLVRKKIPSGESRNLTAYALPDIDTEPPEELAARVIRADHRQIQSLFQGD